MLPPFGNDGAGGDGGASAVGGDASCPIRTIVARLMRCIRLGTTFEVYGDGSQVRDYVHAHDVVAAMRLGLTDHRWTVEEVLKERLFPARVELPKRWADYYWRR